MWPSEPYPLWTVSLFVLARAALFMHLKKWDSYPVNWFTGVHDAHGAHVVQVPSTPPKTVHRLCWHNPTKGKEESAGR